METPRLRRGADGYWRCNWRDASRKRHFKAFGKDRAQARNAFQEWLTRWVNDPAVRTPTAEPPLTVQVAWNRYSAHAKEYYRHADGTPTRTPENIGYAMRPMLALFGDRHASEITPKLLAIVRDRMIEDGLCVSIVNQRINMIRRVWKWLVRNELVSASVWHAMCSLEPIKPGRTKAHVPEPVGPVAEEWVEAACAKLPPSLAAMVRVQQWSGMRPGEVCGMRPCDIDTSGAIWIYRPRRHKTAHHGHKRQILLGPRSQALLREYIARDLTQPVFQPGQAMKERHAVRRASYTPPEGAWDYRGMPSYLRRREAAPAPKRYRETWTTSAYALAIKRACVEAGIPHWSPNQLRHSAATKIRKAAGLDAAQVLMGHRKASTTEIYADLDIQRVTDLVMRMG